MGCELRPSENDGMRAGHKPAHCLHDMIQIDGDGKCARVIDDPFNGKMTDPGISATVPVVGVDFTSPSDGTPDIVHGLIDNGMLDLFNQ
jgi:hypothetical protein